MANVSPMGEVLEERKARSLTDLGLQPWETMQLKTFTAFANSYLVRSDPNLKITNMADDFQDGVRLIVLIEALTGQSLGKYHKTPRMPIQKVENCNLPLKVLNDFNKSKGIKLEYSAEQMTNCELKPLMGMMWIVISKFLLENVSEEELNAKEALLLWCQRKTAGYEGVSVTDFTGSWQSGLAFAALVHKHRPDLIDFDSLRGQSPTEVLETAFAVAETHLQIPRLLDVEDLADRNIRPDEKSIMTYLTFVWKAFAHMRKAEIAGRRVVRALNVERNNEALKQSAVESAQSFVDWTIKQSVTFEARPAEGDENTVALMREELEEYKTMEKPNKAAEKSDVESAFAFLTAKLQAEGRPAWYPPSSLSIDAINARWADTSAKELGFETFLGVELSGLQRQEVEAAAVGAQLMAASQWNEETASYVDSALSVEPSVAAFQAAVTRHELYEDACRQYQLKLEKLAIQVAGLGQEPGSTCIHTSVRAAKAQVEAMQQDLDATGTRLAAGGAQLQAGLLQQKALDAQRLEWAKKAEAFNLFVDSAMEDMDKPIVVKGLEELDELDKLLDSKMEEVTAKRAELEEMKASHASLHPSGGLNPYARFDVDALEQMVEILASREDERRSNIEQARETQRRYASLRSAYVDKVEEFYGWQTSAVRSPLDALKALDDTSPEEQLREQIAQLEALSEKLSTEGEGKVAEVQLANTTILDAGAVSPSNAKSVVEVEGDFDLLGRLLTERKALTDDALQKALGANAVSPEQLAELQELFTKFDKNSDNSLGEAEFKAVMQNMEIEVTDAEVKALLEENGGGLGFDGFVKFLTTRQKDQDTYDQLLESFQQVAGAGATYVTDQQLAAAFEPDDVAYLKEHMPPGPADGTYNFPLYAALVFGISDAGGELGEELKKRSLESEREREADKAAAAAADAERKERERKAAEEAAERERKAAEEAAAREAEAAARREQEERERAEAARIAAEEAAEAKRLAEEAAAAAAAAEAERQRLAAEEAARKAKEAEAKAAEEARIRAEEEAKAAVERAQAEELHALQERKAKGMSSFLHKLPQGRSLFSGTSWKRRFYNISFDGVLRYYDNDPAAGGTLKGECPMAECSRLRLSASHLGRRHCFAFEFKDTTLWQAADSSEEAEAWADLLRLYIAGDDLKQFLTVKQQGTFASTRRASMSVQP
eukprot:CAMPEP_0170162364 /NCGR_PEP_ID=MMETSP0033_2-20121228/77057_1 /TAXON_ID=195969 /ORGANISM="Dolichomastix tenuilepis, Strain CCMP3274" /LENGTH=1176 /DNA_ID=CAMNT_0010399989 /DNA_START=503 /DNA_END=4033 /DNA_ORIENTATION=-